jgi:hypothetical protein
MVYVQSGILKEQRLLLKRIQQKLRQISLSHQDSCQGVFACFCGFTYQSQSLIKRIASMNLQRLLTSTGILSGSLVLAATPAQAFTFATNLASGSNEPKGDIFLKSVTLSGGRMINNFSLVNSTTLIQNDPWTGKNTGAASSDRGDHASGVKVEKATESSITASLGNLNLNNIVDTEDRGSFKMNLTFDQAISSLFFWERGMNSKLGVQALDKQGNLIGKLLTLNSSLWQRAGFGIDTTEIEGTQQVGSLGLTLGDLGVSSPINSIQLTSEAAFNGPDFKVVGSSEAVPEPATMAGLALAGAGLTWARRRQVKPQA